MFPTVLHWLVLVHQFEIITILVLLLIFNEKTCGISPFTMKLVLILRHIFFSILKKCLPFLTHSFFRNYQWVFSFCQMPMRFLIWPITFHYYTSLTPLCIPNMNHLDLAKFDLQVFYWGLWIFINTREICL